MGPHLTVLRNAAVVVIASLVFSGCTYRFHMRIEGPLEAPTVTPINSGLFAPKGACLRRFAIASAMEPEAPVWDVRTESDDCVMIDHVTYGEVPTGFVEVQPAKTLVAGVAYHVGPNPRGSPLAEVVYLDGRWRRLD